MSIKGAAYDGSGPIFRGPFLQNPKTVIYIHNYGSIPSIMNADDAFPIVKSQVNRLNMQFSALGANVGFCHF